MKFFLRSSFCILIIFLISATDSFSQDFTISGYIKDAKSNEPLTGASVYVKETSQGTVSDSRGFYSLSIEKGKYAFVVSFIGYEDFTSDILIENNISQNIILKNSSILADEVVIEDKRGAENVKSSEMGVVEMQIKDLKALPVLMGEADPLKSIQLLPGVQSAGEGNSGFYVRGGGYDQNLILLDDAVIYNASHLFGFFSVFNSNSLQNIKLTKAGMPAEYGGRLASVLDITTKIGDTRNYIVEGGIGLISSNLTIQGPVIKDRCSFIVSGRRTYADLLKNIFFGKESKFGGTNYFFHDLNAKLYYKISDKDRLYLSSYTGKDDFDYEGVNNDFTNSIYWGNRVVSLKWSHIYNEKLYSNISLNQTDYQLSFDASVLGYNLKLYSGINDQNARILYSYRPNINHTIKFGSDYTYHTFKPNNVSAHTEDQVLDFGNETKLYSHEGGIFVNDEFDLSDKIRINAGMRYTVFQHVGPFERYIYDENNQLQETIGYDRNEKVKAYNNIEPRLSIRYSIDKRSSFKLGYTQNYQYIHLASVSSVSMPTDIWVPCSSIIKPQFGEQYSAGYFRNFLDNMFETSVELYYKRMKNQIEYRNGIINEFVLNSNFDSNFIFGNGESYGSEFYVKKSAGKVTGWIGYTISKSTRQFDDIDNGEPFYAKYDRRHDLSVVATYKLNSKWSFSAVFVYATGNAMTIPVSRYMIQGNIINEYSKKNAFRMPPYHRMDISATYIAKKTDKYESSWNFSIYNLYSRNNPYYIFFEATGSLSNYNLDIKAKQVALFPILPSVSWSFKF